MDLGLGNLNDLKRELLPTAVRGDTQWDQPLQTVGKGVAAQFENFCNRKFSRVVADTYEFMANTSTVIVPRFPIEQVTLVEERDDLVVGWYTLDGTILFNMREAAGFLDFGMRLGPHLSQIRVTYTGGFWYDISEDYSGEKPEAAAEVPADLKAAWILQCQHVIERRDLLRSAAIKSTEQPQVVATIEILPINKETLKQYIRYAST